MCDAALLLQTLVDEALCPDIDTTKVFGFPIDVNVIDFQLKNSTFAPGSACLTPSFGVKIRGHGHGISPHPGPVSDM